MASGYSFGPFQIDVKRRTVSRDGRPLAIGQRGVAILAALVEARGAPVTKAALMDAAWPGQFIEESNLTVQIASLRKALATEADPEGYIETLPRLGYQLSVRPEPVEEGVDAPVAIVGILPFSNLSSAPEQDYFIRGVADDLLAALSKFRQFAVVSLRQDTAADPRDAFASVGPRYLLEGSVQRLGERLRMSTRLVDAATGVALWSGRLDSTDNDLFAFQDEIAENVAAIVAPQVEKAEMARALKRPRGSISSHDAYLLARSKILEETEPANVEAVSIVTEALVRDPDHPGLLSLAAWAFEHRLAMGWAALGPDDAERCVAFARRGLERADGDTMVMAHCAMALIQTGRDYDRGMAVLRSAVEMNPNNLALITATGVANCHCGTIEEALELLQRAQRLSPRDPLAHIALCGIAFAHLIRGRYEEARAWALRALAVNPNFDPTLWMLTAANAHLGKMDEARRWLAELSRIAPGVTLASIRAGQPAMDPTRLAPVLDGLRLAGLPAG